MQRVTGEYIQLWPAADNDIGYINVAQLQPDSQSFSSLIWRSLYGSGIRTAAESGIRMAFTGPAYCVSWQ